MTMPLISPWQLTQQPAQRAPISPVWTIKVSEKTFKLVSFIISWGIHFLVYERLLIKCWMIVAETYTIACFKVKIS